MSISSGKYCNNAIIAERENLNTQENHNNSNMAGADITYHDARLFVNGQLNSGNKLKTNKSIIIY